MEDGTGAIISCRRTTNAISSLRIRSSADHQRDRAERSTDAHPPIRCGHETENVRLVNSGRFNDLAWPSTPRIVSGSQRTACARGGELPSPWCISRQQYQPAIPIATATPGTVASQETRRFVLQTSGTSLWTTRVSRLGARGRGIALPAVVRRSGAPRNGRLRHVPRQRLVFPPLSEH
jgi:hypothetical protein